MAFKILYVVLDGAADRPSEGVTSLEAARKPWLDGLAGRAVCGLLYTVGRGVAPESDVATMALLGYEPDRFYPGRGPLEALGAGLDVPVDGVAFRANFATVDPTSMRIIDRRVGRSLESWEARELAKALDGMELGGGSVVARFRATIGHRGVLVLEPRGGLRLSPMVGNTDPAYVRRGRFSVAVDEWDPIVVEAAPLDGSDEARLTAGLVNEFTRKALEVLDDHPVNREREARGLPKANAVLLRDAGARPGGLPSFRDLFGLRGASVVEMVVERGIARLVGLRDYPVEVEGRGLGERLADAAERALRALEENDLVYVHLKGPDEPGHDGDFQGKVAAIEATDQIFFSRVLEELRGSDVAVLVTSDHATPYTLKAHSGDPVPFMLHWPEAPRGPGRFTERACKGGTMIEGGHSLLPFALKKLGL